MFQYNELFNRKNTNSLKWDHTARIFSVENADHILPMWLADMDIPTPSFIVDALKERLEHPIFGYTKSPQSLYDAIIKWYKERHHWTIDRDKLLFHEGVVPSMATIIETFTKKGEKVCISPPIYGPFYSVPKNLKREVVDVPLIEEHGVYRYNFQLLEKAFQTGVKVYILSNPHNPAGVVWEKETLTTLLLLARRYNVLIISDEIHCDIVFPPNKHITLQLLNDEIGAEVVTCLSPTKTFNIASVHFSVMVASNKALTARLKQNAMMHGRFNPNVFAMVAAESAYTLGAKWTDGLIQHISENMDYVINACRDIAGVRILKPQGTYLLWLDYRETNLDEKEIQKKLLLSGLGLDPGAKFGDGGDGFLRMNVAAPRQTIEEAVYRLHLALDEK